MSNINISESFIALRKGYGDLLVGEASTIQLHRPRIYTLPIYWQQTKKKTVLVGMNAYRNWHYLVSAKFKREFGDLINDQVIEPILLTKPYKLHIKVYYKNPICDGSNIVALIEKVFLDALISAGILPNDTVQWHLGTTWEIVSQDKINPRCELTIKET